MEINSEQGSCQAAVNSNDPIMGQQSNFYLTTGNAYFPEYHYTAVSSRNIR